MEYSNFKKDFVSRTINILEDTSKKTQYEVTLLLNCLLGLMVFPIESTKSNKNCELKVNCVKKLIKMEVIKKPKLVTNLDYYKIFKSMRNAVSHGHIETSGTNDYIEGIKFSDFDCNNLDEPHTCLEFNVEQLKEYALYVATQYLELLKEDCLNQTRD